MLNFWPFNSDKSSLEAIGDVLNGEQGGDADMMGMMGGMMGGGMGGLPSSSATSGNGDFGASGANVGGMVINPGPTETETMTKWIVAAVVIIVVAFVWNSKKK